MTYQGSRNITIEKVRYTDLNDLEKIFTREFGAELDVEIIKQRIRRIRQFYFILLPLSSVSLWLKNLFSIYVCRVEGKVAGFIQVSFFNRGQLHLDYIAVNKKFRGQGLGTFILKKLIERAARNSYDIILEVRSDNPAYQLYERLGFAAQVEIVHYNREIDENVFTRKRPCLLYGIRRRKDSDWRQIYQLYLKSLPVRLHKIARREIGEFSPSLLTKTLDWFKSYMMGTIKQQYVLESKGRVIGSLELQSYINAKSHIMNVMLDPGYDRLREPTYRYAMHLLSRFKEGLIATTIYRDGAEKEQTLSRLGFEEKESYFLMFRPAHPVAAKINAASKHGSSRLNYHKTLQSKPPKLGYAAIR